MSNLLIHMAHDHAGDLRREAERIRRARKGAATREECLVIRPATARDRDAVIRLEQLEGRALAPGSALVAEVDGEVLAALQLANGSAVADPFRRTAHLVRQLEARRDNGSSVRGRRRLRSLLRTRLEPQRHAAGC